MQKNVVALLIFLLSLSLMAQTTGPILGTQTQGKLDLGTRTSGQLPASSGTQVLGLAGEAGVHHGAHSQHGYFETFNADGHCVPSTTHAKDFDYDNGTLDCGYQPGYYHPGSSTMRIERVLSNGSYAHSPAIYPPPTNFASLVFTAPLGGTGGGGSAYVGFDYCAALQYDCGAANEIGILVNSGGVSIQAGGTTTVLWNATINNSGYAQIGTINSAVNGTGGSIGWGAPMAGYSYSYGLMLPGDGTAIVSAIPVGGALNYPQSDYFVARIPLGSAGYGSLPSGSMRSFFISGNTQDFVSDVSYAAGFQEAGTQGAPVYAIAPENMRHGGRIMRWAVHSDGTECTYSNIASDCMNVFALIPPNYNPNAANPWALYFRGQYGTSDGSCCYALLDYVNTFGPMGNSLYVDGMVQIYADWNHGLGWYGSPNSMRDVANAVHIVRDSLTLAARPIILADSAGGINAANAITHGVVSPKAWLCYSCNLNLLADAQGTNTGDQYTGTNQMPYIETDYGFGDPSQYATYTAGFDPMAVVQSPNMTFSNSVFDSTLPLLPHAGYILAAVPTLLIADQSPGDGTVSTPLNTDAYYTAINALNPGVSSRVYTIGGHVSANKFDPAQALNWINAHQ